MDSNNEPRTTAEKVSEYATLLWKWAWLLILSALLAGGVAYWVARHQTPVYQATALVLVDSAPDSQTLTYSELTTSQQLASTYAREMITTPLLDEVAKRLKLAAFPDTASVDVEPIQNTQLMTVTIQDTDRMRVALLASTLVQVFSDQLQADNEARYAGSKKGLEEQLANLDKLIQGTTSQLDTLSAGDQNRQNQLQTALTGYRQSYSYVLQSYQNVLLAEAQSSSGIILRQPPVTPDTPVKPTPIKNTILATLLGLLLALGAVLLIDLLDNTIRNPEEITRRWGVPVLGTIISHAHAENSLITFQQPRSPITEAFRSLRTNLNYASFDRSSPTILITSPSPEDGKTTVAANLANVIAQGGRKVVVVDADMRRPRIHKVFQMSNRAGLSDQFIHPEDRFNGSLKQSKVTGLQVLTSGNVPPNPAELLGSEKMIQILKQLSNHSDMTILDAPPLLTVTDALVLAPLVDGVILVVKPSLTKRAALKNAFGQMQQVKANVIGVVLNDVKINQPRYYHYSGYYYHRKYTKGYQCNETDKSSYQICENSLPAQDVRMPEVLDDLKNTPVDT
ncbi:MAG: polysaccharide biosynthesis tyrosine autokinase [Anaerolineales bacterium]